MKKVIKKIYLSLTICFLTAFLSNIAHAAIPGITSVNPARGTVTIPLDVAITGTGFDVNTSVSMYLDSGNKRKIIGSLDFPSDIYLSHIEISGNYAYIAAQTNGTGALYVVDISNSSNPQIAGIESIPVLGQDVAVSGDYAYLTANASSDINSGLYVINVSNPADPEIAGFVSISNANKIIISGNKAYIGAGNAFYIVDVTDPSTPQASAPVAVEKPVTDILISGGYAYIVGSQFFGATSLYVIDLSNTANKGSVEIDTNGTNRYSSINISGNYAYIGGNTWISPLYLYQVLPGHIKMVNISSPLSPVLSGVSDFPVYVNDMYISESTAYVAGGASGLHVMDISSPLSPEITGTFGTSNASDGAGKLAVAGAYAYVVGAWTLDIMDISSPEEVQVVGSLDTPGMGAGHFIISGNYAYVADGTSGLQVIDISNPLDLCITGSAATSQPAGDIFITGTTAQVLDRNKQILQLIDITNPSSPQSGESVGFSSVEYSPQENSGSTGSIFVNGSTAYLGRTSYLLSGGSQLFLKIVDITTPSNPLQIGSLQLDFISTVMRITVHGNYAYIGGLDSSFNALLGIVDISDPSNPQLMASMSAGSTIGEIFVSGNYVYISGQGLRIINISDPSFPVLTGTLSLPSTIGSGLLISGNYAYLTDFGSGLYMVDITDPAHPVLTGSVDTPGFAGDVFVSGNYAIVADGDGLVTVPLPVEVSPLTVNSVTSISATLPGPTVPGYYTLKVFNDEGSDELFGAVEFEIPDMDDDGLPDSIESEYCTEINNPDSDDDGILDGIEDTNHNGIVDAGESKPCSVDSDGDGLNDGVEDANFNGQLDASETDATSADTDDDGLNDNAEINTYGTNPTGTDTDGDGVNDYDEVITYGTDPLDTDTDNDGRSDKTEINDASYPTNPTDPDSDDDGVNDGLEVSSGTNPLNAGDYPAHGTITGTIYDSTGSLITGTSIEVTAYQTSSPCNTSAIIATAMSDPVTGIFTITGLPANDYYIKAMDSSNNYATEYYNADPDDPSTWNCNDAEYVIVNNNEITNEINFELGPGATITGRVTDSDTGLGVFDMSISAFNAQCNPSNSWSAVTDYKGNYTFTGLPAGESIYLRTYTMIFKYSAVSGYTWNFTDYISVWHDGSYAYLCNGVSPVVLEKENEIDFELNVGRTIEGKVTDQETGLGISYAFVSAYTAQCDGQTLHYGISSLEGDYTIKGLPPGELFYVKVIQAIKSEYINNAYVTAHFVNEFYDDIRMDLCDGAIPVSAPSSGIDFELEAGGTIKGRVTDAETGMGIPNISVEVWTAQCGGTQLNFETISNTNFEGYYTLYGLPIGESYYVRTDDLSSQNKTDYIHEWHGGASADTCSGAVLVPVLSTDINFVLQQDTDEDGMPNEWEISYGLNPNNNSDAGIDSDSDGLLNLKEYQIGTNPKDVDTDDDNLYDGEEDINHDGIVNAGETNPLDSDSDSDGMPDGWEVDNDLNPLVNDANNDADDDGFKNLMEYKKGTDPLDPDSHPPRSMPWLPLLLGD